MNEQQCNEAALAFLRYLDERIERRDNQLGKTEDGRIRVIIKTEAAELDVVRREFRRIFGL